MSWIKAVKIWNDKREGKKYMIPRKGTEEHAQVMSIMKGQQNGKGLRQVGTGHKYNGKQKAFLKALEGEKKSSRKNKARDARVMRRYKKIVKGGNLEKLAVENPELLYNLGKLAYNVQEAPKLEDGKLQVPKTPLENLWSSIFG